MHRVLVAVDGSQPCERAVAYLADLIRRGWPREVHVLNVQPPILSGEVRRFVTQDMIDTYHREEGHKALEAAERKLNAAGVVYVASIRVGHVAETIAEYVRQQRCDAVLMGTRGLGSTGSLVLGSVATKVVHLVDVPVTLVK
jgi:nucleotide-binding universal stress UspA family protein